MKTWRIYHTEKRSSARLKLRLMAELMPADAEPDDRGFYPCVDLSYIRKVGGDWTEDGVERMAIGDETGGVFALRWNPVGKNYEVAEAL